MRTFHKDTGKTKASYISSTLRNAIIFGDLKPGEKITESRISEKFKTSHIPVREALKQLEREGFVESKPYSGNFVRKTCDENLIEYCNIHKVFIRNFLKHAIPEYTEKDYKKFDDIINKINRSSDYREASLYFFDLNEMLYAPAKMPYMLSLLTKLFNDNLMYQSVYFKEISKGKINTEYISKFLKICRKGKVKEAVDFWIKIQDQETKILINHFRKEKQEKFFM